MTNPTELVAPSEEMVEKVARGLAKRNYPGASKADIDEMWDAWEMDARAAIAVMQPEGCVLVPRVPTEAMRQAAKAAFICAHPAQDVSATMASAWGCMIAAAMSGKEGGR